MVARGVERVALRRERVDLLLQRAPRDALQPLLERRADCDPERLALQTAFGERRRHEGVSRGGVPRAQRAFELAQQLLAERLQLDLPQRDEAALAQLVARRGLVLASPARQHGVGPRLPALGVLADEFDQHALGSLGLAVLEQQRGQRERRDAVCLDRLGDLQHPRSVHVEPLE